MSDSIFRGNGSLSHLGYFIRWFLLCGKIKHFLRISKIIILQMGDFNISKHAISDELLGLYIPVHGIYYTYYKSFSRYMIQKNSRLECRLLSAACAYESIDGLISLPSWPSLSSRLSLLLHCRCNVFGRPWWPCSAFSCMLLLCLIACMVWPYMLFSGRLACSRSACC